MDGNVLLLLKKFEQSDRVLITANTNQSNESKVRLRFILRNYKLIFLREARLQFYLPQKILSC